GASGRELMAEEMAKVAIEQAQLQFFLDPAAKARGVAFKLPRGGDAGFDIQAAEELTLAPGTQALVATGLHVAIPAGWVGVVKDRSSMALKQVYTHAGVIDADYRGEVKIVLSNHASEPFQIQVCAKIAQMLLLPCLTSGLEVGSLEKLGATERGSGGFGSTGA
ncbi:dUTP diphosphatase, partial [Oligoflexia bacterium]|nr:dUTP diphosphatase [Oligoflexia bacterium]